MGHVPKRVDMFTSHSVMEAITRKIETRHNLR